ncbi:MAG: hypothetical protein AABZ53_01545 [Planctomycetota bacterium]
MSVDSTPANPAPTQVLAIDRTILCIRCGYDLMGLKPAGVCPECGTPVERSMRGDLLEYCGEEYLASLHWGLFWTQTSLLLLLIFKVPLLVLEVWVGMGVSTGLPAGMFEPIARGIELGPTLLFVLGWWRLSTPDPGQLSSNKGEGARRHIRLALAVTVCTALIQFVTAFMHLPSPIALLEPHGLTPGAQPSDVVDQSLALLSAMLWLLAFVAWAVTFFAAMAYVHWIARRVPNAKARTRASLLIWLCPVLYIFGRLCVGLGPLIALVLYYNLLDWLRIDLKNIRAKTKPLASPR